jgi:NDP-sugar pyrophosphorylase family protein
MKIYVVKKQETIEPFEKRANDLSIGNKKLSVLQNNIFSKLNLNSIIVNNPSEIKDNEEHLIIDDNIYFEYDLLKEFIYRSEKIKSSTICSVKEGIFTEKTFINLQNVKKQEDYFDYNLFYFPQEKLREETKKIIFDLNKKFEYLPLPKHLSKDEKYFIPLTTKSIIQIDHWSNLWSANLAVILSMIEKANNTNKLILLLLAIKNFSFNKWRVAMSINKIGRNCDIHPTAIIECSEIGDNVIIGAGTIIRECIIGANTFVGNGITIEYSVIGNNCTIVDGHILYSTIYPNAQIANQMISASILGENVFIGSGVVLTDLRLDNKNVLAKKAGALIDTGNLFLGSCLGDGVYLGSGCIVSPGRSIPNGLHIYPKKDRTISKIDNKKIEGFEII